MLVIPLKLGSCDLSEDIFEAGIRTALIGIVLLRWVHGSTANLLNNRFQV